MYKKLYIQAILCIFITIQAWAQPRFSIATHPEVLRSLRKEQQFWAFGHNTQAQFHLTPKDGIYVSFGYYSAGKFENQLEAKAKDIIYAPQQIAFTNQAGLNTKHFAAGWKKFLKGNAEAEESWNLYSIAGFGLLFGKISNVHSSSVDTTKYVVPVLEGAAKLTRLTYDIGLGVDVPTKGDIYFYSEAKLCVPAWGYPSNYLLVNDKAPFMATFGAGIRILF
ncbi:MAG: hypothetical protein IPH18_06965 [Chitinophagaceae bacterium]|nr:hypothetical protein [Chitinophagaceae bacterium]MBK8951076.1 hypothetical protein [Chitinophagaceae bacterium]